MQSLSHQMLDWARKMPADEEYSFLNASECAFAQFAIAHGLPDPVRGNHRDIPEPIRAAVLHGSWTFGALASRLEAELAK